jgi:hypothetical protein
MLFCAVWLSYPYGRQQLVCFLLKASTMKVTGAHSQVLKLGCLLSRSSRINLNGLSQFFINFVVLALMDISRSLKDPHNVLESWDETAVDPCSWFMVTCSPDGLVIGL